MRSNPAKFMAAALAAAGLGATGLPAAGPALGAEPARVALPIPDAERGRELFIHKGCFVCHQVNGVGGSAGPALDVETRPDAIDPLDFAARMWRGALAMADLQSMEFGYQIELDGPEIADLAAFAADPAAQDAFSEEMIPEIIRGWIVDYETERTPLDDDFDGE